MWLTSMRRSTTHMLDIMITLQGYLGDYPQLTCELQVWAHRHMMCGNTVWGSWNIWGQWLMTAIAQVNDIVRSPNDAKLAQITSTCWMCLTKVHVLVYNTTCTRQTLSEFTLLDVQAINEPKSQKSDRRTNIGPKSSHTITPSFLYFL